MIDLENQDKISDDDNAYFIYISKRIYEKFLRIAKSKGISLTDAFNDCLQSYEESDDTKNSI